jgi:5-methylcytosine-specific restriction endonuclease McrA
VLARDCYLCQYCGRGSRALTVDHVMPRSRGGDTSWENVVAACVPCNRRKGARLPQEAGMRLMHRPLAPSRALLLCRGIRAIPALWEPYLAYAS